MILPTYDPTKTYRWNYDHPPAPVEMEIPSMVGDWTFVGLPAASPLGIPAGPLLNGRWCLYYASLGFDVLTYKTVRSLPRECFPLPNLLPVNSGQLTGREQSVPSCANMQGSWAVSFGMPSASPDVWRRDIEWTRQHLPAEKLLSVSVVGSVQDGWSITELAADYARCASWALEAGADCIEANLSCPNVATCDGQLYQNPDDAKCVARSVRSAIGSTPFLIKIGHFNSDDNAIRLLDAVDSWVDGLALTNSVAAKVQLPAGHLAFEGQKRGICGSAIREASLTQVQRFYRILARRDRKLHLVACGGASSGEHVKAYMKRGASAVHIATAAMIDPMVAIDVKHDLNGH